MRHEVDYAALGHIHSRHLERIGETTLSYPGSACVWRKSESGPRGVNIVTVADSMEVRFEEIHAAGQYRQYEIPVSVDGNIERVESLSSAWQSSDWIEFTLKGLVENEAAIEDLRYQLESEWGPKVRKFDLNLDTIQCVSGILDQPLVRSFLRNWGAKKPPASEPQNRSVWLKARELGLEQIRQAVEARR